MQGGWVCECVGVGVSVGVYHQSIYECVCV